MTTAPDQQTFDQILEQTFPKDIQQKRIRKELISLNDLDQNYYKINLQNSSLGLKVVVEFTELFIQREIQQNSNLQHPIILELLLDPQFPFNLPKLFCRTSIFQPSLADGRDFLEDAIERPWSPTILLREVITSIPTFLKKINRLQDPADSQKMGQYYIGDLYSLEDMLGYETVNLFTGDEVIEKKSTAPRYIVVAESHFLKFETADNSRNTLRLLTWANLNSIANIKRSKDDERSVLITFLDKEKTNGIAQLMLLTKEANRLEDLLLDLGERYGAKIKQGAISDFDLTPYTAKLTRQITEKNVEETLEDIHQLETRLEIEVTKDLVYTLMAFYQKIVEHFATYDDPLVDEFVSKLRSLMEREDVQTALKNNQENEERKKTQTLTKQKTIDTDIEDEEEKKESNEPYSWQDQDDNNASLDGGDRVVISQSQKLEVQRPVPEEVKNQQEEENEWKEYESKGTEEAEKEPEYVENKPQEEEVYEAQVQENIENRQEDQFVEQQEENIPAQEEAQIEQKWQEEEREVVENQENKEEEFEGYQQEQQHAQEYQQEVQEENQQYVQEEVQENQPEAPIQEEYQQNFQEEQVEAPIQQEEEVAVQYEEPVVQQEEEVVPEQKEEEIQREEQQEEEVAVQYEEPVVQKEEEIQREEQQEEVQVQEDKQEEVIENKEEEAVQENQVVEENQVEEQNENIEAKVEEEVVNEPVEEKEEVQVQENKEEEVIENREEEAVQENQVVEELTEAKVEEAQIEEHKNEEETAKVEENQESPEKGENEAHENENEGEGEEETQGQEQGQGEGSKKNKKKKNKKKK